MRRAHRRLPMALFAATVGVAAVGGCSESPTGIRLTITSDLPVPGGPSPARLTAFSMVVEAEGTPPGDWRTFPRAELAVATQAISGVSHSLPLTVGIRPRTDLPASHRVQITLTPDAVDCVLEPVDVRIRFSPGAIIEPELGFWSACCGKRCGPGRYCIENGQCVPNGVGTSATTDGGGPLADGGLPLPPPLDGATARDGSMGVSDSICSKIDHGFAFCDGFESMGAMLRSDWIATGSVAVRRAGVTPFQGEGAMVATLGGGVVKSTARVGPLSPMAFATEDGVWLQVMFQVGPSVSTGPNARIRLASLGNSDGVVAAIEAQDDGFHLLYGPSPGTDVGSFAPVLTTGVWHCLELGAFRSPATLVGRVNDSEYSVLDFAVPAGDIWVSIGAEVASGDSATGDIFFDEVVISDRPLGCPPAGSGAAR